MATACSATVAVFYCHLMFVIFMQYTEETGAVKSYVYNAER